LVYPQLNDPTIKKNILYRTENGNYPIAYLGFGIENDYLPFGYSNTILQCDIQTNF
jgi:hypothetical protein